MDEFRAVQLLSGRELHVVLAIPVGPWATHWVGVPFLPHCTTCMDSLTPQVPGHRLSQLHRLPHTVSAPRAGIRSENQSRAREHGDCSCFCSQSHAGIINWVCILG